MTFLTPFGHYEWNVMSFGLKNASSVSHFVMDLLNSLSFMIMLVLILCIP
jgi:hypothetical protein